MAESKSKYVVLPNNHVRVSAGDPEHPKNAKVLGPGDEIDLTKAEAESMKGIVGTAADFKKAETLEEARKLLADEERSKQLAQEAAEAAKKK